MDIFYLYRAGGNLPTQLLLVAGEHDFSVPHGVILDGDDLLDEVLAAVPVVRQPLPVDPAVLLFASAPYVTNDLATGLGVSPSELRYGQLSDRVFTILKRGENHH